MQFEIGDYIFLKVSLTKGVMRLGRRGKLSSRYIGPFEVLECKGEVAYEIALPLELSQVYPVFHVSILGKYVPDLSHVVEYQLLDIRPNLTYEERPIRVLDQKEQVLKNKVIPFVKILWCNGGLEESTWESEAFIHRQYPQLFGK